MTFYQTLGRIYSRDHTDCAESLVRLKKALADPQATFDSLLRHFREFEVNEDRHMRWEEETLFPLLEESVVQLSEGPGSDLRHDHEEIRQRFRTMADSLRRSRSATGAAVDEMLSRLQAHHHKEEEIYYRLADSRISEAEFSRIASLLEPAAPSVP